MGNKHYYAPDPDIDDFFEDETDYPRSRVGRGHPLTDLKLIGPFLSQPVGTARWCGAGGQYIEVSRMGASHAAATVNFLLRRARDIFVTHALAMGSDPLNYAPALTGGDARLWLLTQPLLSALVAQAKAGGEKQDAYPWERSA